MTENMIALQEAKQKLAAMVAYVSIYEEGTMGDPNIFEVTLTTTQINQLKAKFVAARTACITEMNKVSG